MNILASFASAMLLLASPAVTPVQAPAPSTGPACIVAQRIQRTEVQDDQTILFHMRDGKIWANKLRRVCPMLTTSPWTQVLHSDQICANQQFIHVRRTGDTCSLGEFTPVEPQP